MKQGKLITKIKAKQLDKKALKEIMRLDGSDCINVITSLYKELLNDLQRIEKERSELVQSINNIVDMRLKFIKEAWEDLELTKEEKKKLYNDYNDTASAFQQYLIDKEKELMKEKKKKENVKVVSIGGIIISVTTVAVVAAVKSVLTVVNTIKK